jgi:hypothetical protein
MEPATDDDGSAYPPLNDADMKILSASKVPIPDNENERLAALRKTGNISSIFKYYSISFRH